jgi:hypothetical protein
MTSKPSIFEKGIVENHDDDADIRAMVRERKGAREDVHYANDPK